MRGSRGAAGAGARVYVTGVLMLGAAGWLAALAERIGPGTPTPEGRWALTLWGMAAGGAYLAGLWPLHCSVTSGRQHSVNPKTPSPCPLPHGGRGVLGCTLVWVWSIGLAMRAILMPTTPFLEDDFYRYLWDGGVTAHGANPYQHAPAEALRAAVGPEPGALPPALCGAEACDVLTRINHPHLTTVYGPVAQLAFAAAHVISPWNVLAWRGVLLVFDGLTMVALLALLRALRAPAVWAAWYWWNPLLLREVISSGHVDVIALPLVIAALLLAGRHSPIAASVVLALAAGVKLWPIVLLPLVIRAGANRARTAFLAVGAFFAASALMWAPALAAARSESNGFRAYALTWHDNDAVFRAAVWTTQRALPLIHVDRGHAPRLARILAAGALAACVAVQTWRLTPGVADFARRSLLVVAVTFVLSPAQFPWYYLWMLPLLAAAPCSSLLAYTVVLPLYYVHHEYPWVVWIEHLPVLGWFFVELWMSSQRRRVPASQVEAV